MFGKRTRTALLAAAFSMLVSGLPLYGVSPALAAENEELPPPSPQQGQILQSREIDVTGDGKLDTVTLVGMRTDTTSPYYPHLQVVVNGPAQGQRQVVIPLQGGYNPLMQFCDFNGDQLPEIYVAAETGGSGGLSNYYLYSLKNNVPTAIPIPQMLHVTAKFKNNYVVKLKIDETGKSYKIDLKDKKKDYDEFGVYKNGKLVKPIAVSVNPYGMLQPIDIDQDGTCELKGVQRMTGIANADTIGYVISVWKWKGDKWALVASEIKKSL